MTGIIYYVEANHGTYYGWVRKASCRTEKDARKVLRRLKRETPQAYAPIEWRIRRLAWGES